jgi:hypothetical protein
MTFSENFQNFREPSSEFHCTIKRFEIPSSKRRENWELHISKRCPRRHEIGGSGHRLAKAEILKI